ncbi:hypothetical protein SLOPH_1845, partial [Spraguea lophii 42_110]
KSSKRWKIIIIKILYYIFLIMFMPMNIQPSNSDKEENNENIPLLNNYNEKDIKSILIIPDTTGLKENITNIKEYDKNNRNKEEMSRNKKVSISENKKEIKEIDKKEIKEINKSNIKQTGKSKINEINRKEINKSNTPSIKGKNTINASISSMFNLNHAAVPSQYNNNMINIPDISDTSTLLLDDEEPYLSNIYDLFVTLNKKMDMINITDNLYSLLKMKRIDDAIKLIEPIANKDNYIKYILQKDIKEINKEIKNIIFIIDKYKKMVISVLVKSKIQMENGNESKNIIEYIKNKIIKNKEVNGNELGDNDKINYNDRNYNEDKTNDKNYIINDKTTNEVKNKSNDRNYNENKFNVIIEIDNILNKYNNLYLENKELKEILNKKEYEEKNDIMKSNLEQYNKLLSSDNIKLSDNVTMLREKSVELQKENVMLSSELFKYKDIIRDRNKIIERQKKVIEILQGGVGKKKVDYNFVDEIRMRIEMLKLKEMECKDKEREEVRREIKDYEKRLKDFIGISK